MKAFITKYATTQGILGKYGSVLDNEMFKTDDTYPSYFHKGDWFLVESEAIKDADARRKKKIKSLQKQIEKLKAMTFE